MGTSGKASKNKRRDLGSRLAVESAAGSEFNRGVWAVPPTQEESTTQMRTRNPVSRIERLLNIWLTHSRFEKDFRIAIVLRIGFVVLISRGCFPGTSLARMVGQFCRRSGNFRRGEYFSEGEA